MASYNQQKVLSELGKLNTEELYNEYLIIKDFTQKQIAAEQAKKEDEASELQSKLQKLTNN